MTSTAAASGDSRAFERWVLIATILASSMAFIDGSALNVVLPRLQTAFDATGTQVFWIVSIYNLFLAALIIVGGSLGDHYGRSRIYRYGILLFTAASVVCGLSPSADLLILARAVQGVGGALMIPGSLAIIAALFPVERRGVAIGTWSTFTTAASLLGPVLGGWLANQGLWRAVFFINLPLALVALYALRFVPETRDEHASKRLDWPGTILVTVGLAGLTFGFIQGSTDGYGQPQIVAALAGGVIALIAFVVVEARSPHPMVPLGLFKSRTFSGTNALTILLYAALAAFSFFLPLNLAQVQGYSEDLVGLAMLPFTILLILLSRQAGKLVARIGPRIMLTVGPAIVGVGLLVFALIGLTRGPGDYWLTFFPGALLIGLGMGITVAPLTTAVMSSAPSEASGIASGINNAVSRIGGALAVAILGGVALIIFTGSLQTRTDSMSLPADAQTTLMRDEAPKLAAAQPPASLPDAQKSQVQQAVKLSFIDAYQTSMLACAVLAWLSALLAFLLVEDHVIVAQAE